MHLINVIEELIAELKADYEIKLRWRKFTVGTLHAFLVRLSEVATVFQANYGRLREFKGLFDTLLSFVFLDSTTQTSLSCPLFL